MANNPTQGARYLLEREREEGTRAIYKASILTPERTFESRATLSDDGSVDLAPTGAPPDLEATLLMIARLTARAAQKKREDGLVPWPSRVLRWRGPGRGE